MFVPHIFYVKEFYDTHLTKAEHVAPLLKAKSKQKINLGWVTQRRVMYRLIFEGLQKVQIRKTENPESIQHSHQYSQLLYTYLSSAKECVRT